MLNLFNVSYFFDSLLFNSSNNSFNNLNIPKVFILFLNNFHLFFRIYFLFLNIYFSNYYDNNITKKLHNLLDQD